MSTTATISPTAGPTAAPPPAPPAERRRRKDDISGWAFSAPFLAFFLVFLVWPLIYGFFMSMTGKSLTGANDDLIGFANYAEALSDAGMWRSLGNTLYFTVISTVPLVLVALVMAALLNVGLPAQWL